MQRSDITQAMVDEGQIEVGVYAMAYCENGDAGLACALGKEPEFWSVELRPTDEMNGSTDPFEEHDDLPSAEAASKIVAKLEAEFPGISVEWI